jgi:hypothetical protein
MKIIILKQLVRKLARKCKKYTLYTIPDPLPEADKGSSPHSLPSADKFGQWVIDLDFREKLQHPCSLFQDSNILDH